MAPAAPTPATQQRPPLSAATKAKMAATRNNPSPTAPVPNPPPATNTDKLAHQTDTDTETNDDKTLPAKFDRTKVNLDKGLQMIEDILDNMMLANGTGLMLAGEPGVGKTTFIKRLSKLLGIPVIVIETPHVTEEHLVNIPFLVINPASGSEKAGSAQVDTKEFSVSLAKSHLASQLAASHPVPDAQYATMVTKFDSNLKAFFELLGGINGKVPPDILRVRQEYRVILFLDEYFRQASANVRNILRGILNGKIGNDDVPEGTFIVYASNLQDSGGTVEDIPLNADFKKLDFDTPSKDEWFHYFISKFENDEKVKLKQIVVDSFYAVLDDSHMSHNDIDSEIRTSPRRWEQLLLYINESVPVRSEEEAAALLTNVKANFRDQDKVSSLYKLVQRVTKEIISKTSGIDASHIKELTDDNWRATLEHQIQTKIKLGDHRSYIPIVQGLPGIGKTAQAHEIAKKHNLRLIDIDASTLSVDDITGIPLPDKKGDKMEVDFSPPALYQKIMNDIAALDKKFAEKNDKAEQLKFNQQEFKYLIFFDEINRVRSINVFNALRRVILEKTFTDQLRLPSSAVIVAAMNPTDKGTVELTGHLKDVVDRIDTAPSWKGLSSYIEGTLIPKLTEYSPIAKNLCLKILHAFVDQFTPKTDSGGKSLDATKFYLNLKNVGEIYISPREYSSMYQEMVVAVQRAIDKPYSDQEELHARIVAALARKMEATLSWIFTKHEVDSPQFLNSVKSWLSTSGIVQRSMTKQRTKVDLTNILNNVVSNPTKHLKDDLDFNNYINTFELNKFSEDFHNFLSALVATQKNKLDFIIAKTHSKKELKGDKIEIVKDTVSQLEFIAREIVNACRVHKMSNDVIDQVSNTVTKQIQDILNDDESIPFDQFTNALNVVKDLHKSLRS